MKGGDFHCSVLTNALREETRNVVDIKDVCIACRKRAICCTCAVNCHIYLPLRFERGNKLDVLTCGNDARKIERR